MGKKGKSTSRVPPPPVASPQSTSTTLPMGRWRGWKCCHDTFEENLSCVATNGDVEDLAALLASHRYLTRKVGTADLPGSSGVESTEAATNGSTEEGGLPSSHSSFTMELPLDSQQLAKWRASSRCAIQAIDPMGKLRQALVSGSGRARHTPLFAALSHSRKGAAKCFKKFALLCDMAALLGVLDEAVACMASKSVSLLFHAVESGNVEATGVLLRLGLDPDKPDEYKQSPLKFACMQRVSQIGGPPGTEDDSDLDIAINADTERRDNSLRQTTRRKLVELLLGAGAKANNGELHEVEELKGYGAEMHAMMHEEDVSIGREPDALNDVAKTLFIKQLFELQMPPLALAVEAGDMDLVTLLMSHGADPNVGQLLPTETPTEDVSHTDFAKLLEGTLSLAEYAAHILNNKEMGKLLREGSKKSHPQDSCATAAMRAAIPLLPSPVAGAKV
eukprot:CAMPEP_0197845760 /NCGR_PEP_ID=MMETSP1438-20131217/2649_1 /TAXON_ID=1461541 /ORGANISM="Pterosperma sp., Strain CCMP1384" /LENGTH=447 /DNA_ID=CAMNT_0043457181 /DNA_START=623 /DNA_END=1967 /DNA_ORIENTATION=-